MAEEPSSSKLTVPSGMAKGEKALLKLRARTE